MRAQVKPEANWWVVTYVKALPEPPNGGGRGGSSAASTFRYPYRANADSDVLSWKSALPFHLSWLFWKFWSVS